MEYLITSVLDERAIKKNIAGWENTSFHLAVDLYESEIKTRNFGGKLNSKI